MKHFFLLIVAIWGLSLEGSAHAAQYVCCDMTAPGSKCLPVERPGAHSRETLSNVCPVAGARQWKLAIAVDTLGEGVTVGRVDAAPFHGFCWANKWNVTFGYSRPRWCGTVVPGKDFSVVKSVTSETGVGRAINWYMTIDGGLIKEDGSSYLVSHMRCFSGHARRHASQQWLTRILGEYSCTGLDQLLGELPSNKGVFSLSGHLFPDIETPPAVDEVVVQ